MTDRHPHQALLDEYQFAINHLAPSVPEAIKLEAQQLHDVLLSNPGATVEQIRAAMYKTGRAEYPHRHAHKELVETASDSKRVEMILDHVDETVRGKLKTLLDSGVPLEEITRSSMFETDFTAEQRYQVEDALLDAEDHLKEEMGEVAKERSDEYEKLVQKWEAHAQKIDAKINELDAMRNKDPKWKDEIVGRVQRLREGFLVTEPDPDLLEVEKEIEYWHGTLGEEV